MRVRILKSIASIYGGFSPGMVVDIPEKIAQSWCKAGIAMQDKSIEPKETKAEKTTKQKGKAKKVK